MSIGGEELYVESEPLKVETKVDPNHECPSCGATWRTYWGGLIRRYHRTGCDYIVEEDKINEKYLTRYPELR